MTKDNSIEENGLADEDLQALEDLKDSIDNLVIQLEPKPTQRDIEVENRLSSIEGKLDLLIKIVPVSLGAFFTLIITLIKFWL
jgi:hypothetical protein